ncbi:glycosyltransferase family 2 protein, partial [Candidatus Cyanaurora vandensis]
GGTLLMLRHVLQLALAAAVGPPMPGVDLPTVAVLVPCRNEALVVRGLVANLFSLTYPAELLEVWVADDRSEDGTGEVLRALQEKYPRLRVYPRTEGALGKSAVLNELLARATGQMIVTLDADAQVGADFLTRTLAYFQDPQVGAVQVRRAVVNPQVNWLTQGQRVEMVLDAYYQQQRVLVGGTGELRGSGQVVRRTALEQCSGWNEATITDDLDLTLRLHLNGWQIAFAHEAPVHEEAVTTVPALWRQRQRWAEGGFQRYLDYAPLLGRLGSRKLGDQGVFFTSQYLLPLGLLPDLYWSFIFGHYPVLGFLINAATLTAAWGMFQGQRELKVPLLANLQGVLGGSLYFLHWVPVMIFTLIRMALCPKRLNWVKTPRQAPNR